MLEIPADIRHGNARSGAGGTAYLTSNQTIAEGSIMATSRLCAIEGCCKPQRARTFCAVHYNHWLKGADRSLVKPMSPRGDALAWIIAHVDYDGDECLPWPFGRKDTGYGQFGPPGEGQTTASRYMCRLAHGEPSDPAMHAAHSCGKGHEGCTNPKHLSWKTPVDNIADKSIHGTTQHGERNGQSKLTEEQAAEIKTSPATGRALAAKFGVSASTISLIRSGRRWAS